MTTKSFIIYDKTKRTYAIHKSKINFSSFLDSVISYLIVALSTSFLGAINVDMIILFSYLYRFNQNKPSGV